MLLLQHQTSKVHLNPTGLHRSLYLAKAPFLSELPSSPMTLGFLVHLYDHNDALHKSIDFWE